MAAKLYDGWEPASMPPTKRTNRERGDYREVKSLAAMLLFAVLCFSVFLIGYGLGGR